MSEVEKQLDDVISHLEKEENITLENHATHEPEGVGDTLHNVFSKFGITEERISEFFGLTQGCGCNKRRQFLNRIFPYRKRSSRQNRVD